MADTAALARVELEPLLPLPAGLPDWDDVLARARPAHAVAWPRYVLAAAILVAAVAIAFVTPVRTALAGALDDFSSWLSGTPGTPASQSEQHAFERANERTWAKFAPGTELRRLLTLTRSGTRFTLFGFRSGDDLCLKLVASPASPGDATRCAPEHDLQTTAQPAVVVAADEPLGGVYGAKGPGGYRANVDLATFGIASDGVSRVAVDGDAGAADAELGGNAFLYVADHPKVGARVRSVTAVSGGGKRVALNFESSPFGTFDLAAPPKGTFHGPAGVQRHVSGGTIGWLVRGEHRGGAVQGKLAQQLGLSLQHLGDSARAFGNRAWPRRPVHAVIRRELQPDPNDFVRIVLEGVSPSGSLRNPQAGLCITTVDRGSMGGGCSPLARLFDKSPLSVGMSGSGPSQYTLVTGVADDDVARIAAYLGDGAVSPVALRDNAFIVRVARGAFPLRIVAYDADGKVIAVNDFASDGMTSTAPASARGSVRTLRRVTGERGGTATLRAGKPVGGVRCWSVDFDGGASEGGCTHWPVEEGPLKLLNGERSSGDLFLVGEVPPTVATVRIRFEDGAVQSIDTSDGFAVAAIPAVHLRGTRSVLELDAYGSSGKELAKRGLEVRQPGG